MEIVRVSKPTLGLLGDDNWLSIVTLFDIGGSAHSQFLAQDSLPVPQNRLSRYIRYLHSKYISAYLKCWDGGPEDAVLKYVFQGEDCPRNIKSVTWESQQSWGDICLVPDLYYFMERGYEAFLPEGAALLPWSARRPTVFWRGSTTGIVRGADLHAVGFTAETLDRLPRYQMCRLLQPLRDGADVGIVAVVQCPNEERETISGRLASENLATHYVPLQSMAQYKFLIDIDGNTNSWNFIQRLRLGCCILKVESPWRQWFSHRIQPWVHYVPVKSDLSDLIEMVEWCRTNDREAEAIARNGRDFGLSVNFETEMRQAALDILRAATIVDGNADHATAVNEVRKPSDRLLPKWEAAIQAWSSIPEPMWLRTAHGTILGSDGQGGMPIQLGLGDDPGMAITLVDGDSRWERQLRGLHIDRDGNTVSLERGGLFLSAHGDRATTVCDRLEKHEWETFTLVPARG